jgi:AcrR family transcriptional regulator
VRCVRLPDMGMPSNGLRERKKARPRRHIAETAARLFAERGYEHVSIRDVALEAEVALSTPRSKKLIRTSLGQLS